MQIAIHSGEPTASTAPLVVVAVTADKGLNAPVLGAFNQALGGSLKADLKDEDFSGKSGQQLVVHTQGKVRAKRLALVGLGKAEDVSRGDLVELGGSLARLANKVGAAQALLVLPELSFPAESIAYLVSRGLVLGGYQYTEYKSDPGRKPSLTKVMLQLPAAGKGANAAIKRALTVADAVKLARDLVNESPLQLYPESFAKRAQDVARKAKLKAKVLTPPQLEKMRMGLLLGVGAGSSRSPRLVHLTYTPKGPKAAGKKPIVLVGKGITFDSGGLSLKPSDSMVEMKMDMHGAATVLAVMQVVAELAPPFPVHGIMALAENMPSGTAIRPGDVITGAAGKSVEINNTDAEGRLVLADALHYAQSLEPAKVVDFATLTGACVVALGPYTTGFFCNDDTMAKEILGSAESTGEDFWRMPLNPKLRAMLKSDVADMKNTGERWGGAITAALFLKEFAGDQPWAHCDIAGPAMSNKDGGSITKGGTGVAVATMVDWICGGP